MIFDEDNVPLDEHELAEIRRLAGRQLRIQVRRAGYAVLAFVLSCASVIPFLYGYPLHAYWFSIGGYLVLLSMALLLPSVIYVGIAVSFWFYVRDLEKGEPP